LIDAGSAAERERQWRYVTSTLSDPAARLLITDHHRFTLSSTHYTVSPKTYLTFSSVI